MQNVVGGLVDLQRHVVVEEKRHGRSAPFHANDDLDQVFTDAVEYLRVIGQYLPHSLDVGSAVPALRLRPHRRRDELSLCLG